MADSVVTTLKLIGQRAYISGARASATAIRDVGRASNESSAGLSLLKGGLSAGAGALSLFATGAKAAATAAGALVIYGAKIGLEFDSGMERAQVGMTTLLKNGKQAAETVKSVRDFALKAPLFGVQEMVQSAQQLIGAGIKAKRVTPTLTTFSDTLAAMGRRPEDLQRMTYAFQQMLSKGQISAEELRGQLGEIFPASKLMARGMGISMNELASRMKQGSLKGGKYVTILLNEMKKEFGGATARSAQTFAGMLANIKESVKYTAGLIFKPLFNALKKDIFPWVQKIQIGIQKWAKQGGVQKSIRALKEGFTGRAAVRGGAAGRGVGAAGGPGAAIAAAGPSKRKGSEGAFQKVGKIAGVVFKGLVSYVKQFWAALQPMKPFIVNVLLPFAKGFGMGLLAGLAGIIPVIRIVATILGFIGTKLAFMKGAFQAVGFIIGFVFGPSKIGVFKLFGRTLEFIGGLVGKFIGWLFKVSPAVNRIAIAFLELYWKVISTVGKIYLKIWGFALKVISTGGKMAVGVAKGFGKLLGLLGAKLADIGGAIVGAAATLGSKIGSALGNAIWNAMPEPVKKVLGGTLKIGGKVFNWASGKAPKKGGRVGGIGPTRRRQHGGPASGMTIVGEHGPELLKLPGPSTVFPTMPPMQQPALGGHIKITVPLIIGNREVGRAVAEDTSDRLARK